MNQVLTVMRFVFLVGLITTFSTLEKVSAQPCNNWLSLPSYQSYVSIGDLDIPGNTVTVEATFMRTTPYIGGQIWAGDLVSKHNTPNDANYLLRPNNAEITTTNGYFRTPDICEIELNKTYHAAMTYDGSMLRFYRNGILMSSVPATGNLFQNNFQTRIGLYDAIAFNTNLIGYINEVRIWNVARSQAQIQAFMNSSLPGPTTQVGLLAYYTFDNLLNKQGNAAWNGTLGGNASIGATNSDCTLGTTICNTLNEVTPNFLVQDTVCVGQPVNISNTSLNATSYYWNFCVATTNTTPSAVNLGNIGGVLRQPVFSDIVSDNGNYYVFVSNILPGGLVRLSFGNSLLNNPTITDFGSLGGLIPNTIEGIQVVKNEGRWYAIMVGGDDVVGNIPSRILKIDFGVNINNNAPVGTNWGNIGNLSFPVDLHMFQENGVWYGFTVNANTNTVTRFNFSNSFNNIPTGVNLGNLGGLNYPTGINAIQDNGNWYVFITNDADNGTIVRLDFGNSLLNPPAAVNLGNPGNVLHKTRDIYIMKSCGQITGLAVNGPGYNDLVKLDFNNNILSVPSAVSLGNTGNMNFPHSISKLFRAGNDLYTFVTNVNNNTITRIRFSGCSNSSIPNSALQNPPVITYTTPGTYNINLTVDEGLPTQSSVCKQVVVKDCTVPIIPDFTIPDTICVNKPVNMVNNTIGATSYYWNFCVGDISKTPTGTNIGNVGGLLTMPVFVDYVFVNNNYYGFSINFSPGRLLRWDFGNSLLNIPTAINLGNFGGTIPNYAEGIQVVQNEGRWYAIIVGGSAALGVTPRVLKIDFGLDITNLTPVATNWGNIGNLAQPLDLHVFAENGNWYGFTVNGDNSTITRFNFSNSFNNVPTAVNLGNIGGLAYPTGIYAIKDNTTWRVFITNGGNNSRANGSWSLTRLDFGTSLLNMPTGVNLGNPGGMLKHPRDLTILKSCGETIGFAVNGAFGSSDIIKIDFHNNLAAVPTLSSLGNIANSNFPHSLSKIFRVGDDLYSFVTNVDNNTVTRLRFAGCNNSSIPNSPLQNPPSITYNTPGTYNINLSVDDGLPTQASLCKQVVVMPELVHKPTERILICPGDNIKIGSSSAIGAYLWNNGATSDSIIVNASGIYWVETNSFGCINRDSFEILIPTPAIVDLGGDKTVCSPINVVLDAGNPGSSYLWSDGSSNQTTTITSAGIYYVNVTINGCAYTDTVVINIYAKPIISLSIDTLICKNGQAQLSASGGVSYSWSPAATLNNPAVPNPIATPAANTKYFVAITDANACQYFDSVEVFIRPDAIFTVTDPAPACQFDSVQLSASGGDSYSWQVAEGLSNTNIANPRAAPSATTDYSVTITETTCNQSATLISRVTIWPLPAVDATKLSDIDCRNAFSQLSATGADQYMWTPASTLNDPGIANPIAIPLFSTQYIVAGTDANGCSAKDTVQVDVYDKPTIIVSDDVTICKNAQVQLSATGGASYTWSPAATLNNPFISNPVASPATSTKYYVVVRDNINCEYLDSVEISVRPDPVFTVNSSAQICQNGSLRLNASGGDIYSWSPVQGLNNPDISNPIASPSTTTDYSVTITEATCSQTTTLVTRLTVTPSPVVVATKTNDIDCSNDRSQLNATGAIQYLWTPATTLNNPSVFNPMAAPLATTEYVVEGTDALGCKGYDTISVKVDNVNKGGYLMPNAFTPNYDGLNDCYGIKYWGIVQELEFSIYNRWGQRIFFTKNVGKCWDGTYKGVKQDSGVYVYMIKAKTNCDSEVFRKGTFMLVR